MTLSDLERRGVTGQNFLADIHNYRLTYSGEIWHGNTRVPGTCFQGDSHDSRGIKFRTVTYYVVQRRVYRGQLRPYSKGAGQERPPQYLGSLTYTKRFDLKRRNLLWYLWYYMTCGVGTFLSVSHGPSTVDGSPASPKFFGPPKCARTLSETTTKLCMVIKLHVRKFLLHSTVMLTCDLFVVDNLLFSLFTH